MSAWTRAAIEALGPVTDVPTVASILLVNKDTVYAQIRRGEWTATRVLTLGRKIKIPTRDLIALLYAPEPDSQVTPAVPAQCQHGTSVQVADVEPHTSCGCTPADSAVIRPLRGA
ncbi:DNA binding domain-containing protein, excisionase family [Streptomyces sp. DI166]|uniref:helix-turn-helix domain-containing protein n=1 Tax=Streptomyces sp. DI166 TaxID=1839783 RepID=UPI0007F37B1A|nr:helix-turn-helix domain-containing protein [Streptomyces sp. DI166]SBT91375.1 DNA binding domain-containing protein, excisionase family [Streptomyces sp. DI166]